jgi:hypothetical protein
VASADAQPPCLVDRAGRSRIWGDRLMLWALLRVGVAITTDLTKSPQHTTEKTAMQKVKIIRIQMVEKKETQVQLCELYVDQLPNKSDVLVFDGCRHWVMHHDYVICKDDNVDCLVVYVYVRQFDKKQIGFNHPAMFEEV